MILLFLFLGCCGKSSLAFSLWQVPSLVVDPPQQTINENEMIVICCRLYGGDSNETLIWNGGETSMNILEIKTNFMGQNVHEKCLVMNHSPLSAAGTYECSAAGEGLSQFANVRIVAPPRINASREKVQKGESVFLNCSSINYDSTRLAWSRNYEILQNDETSHLVIRDEATRLNNGAVLYCSLLGFHSARLNDSGNYTCTNIGTGVTATSELIVTDYPTPQVFPTSQSVRLGQNAVIKCKLVSSNYTSLFWRRDGRELVATGWGDPFISMYTIYNGTGTSDDGGQVTWSVLHLYRVTSLAQGNYECIDRSTGVISSASVNIVYRPTIKKFCTSESDCMDEDQTCDEYICVAKTITFTANNTKHHERTETDDLFVGMKLVFACLISGGIVVALLMLYAVIKFSNDFCGSRSSNRSSRSSGGVRSVSGSITGENDKPPSYDQCSQPPSYEDVTALSEYGSVRSHNRESRDEPVATTSAGLILDPSGLPDNTDHAVSTNNNEIPLST